MMETARDSSRSINPWILPLQKLGLELKCPLCLDLLKRPSLLPCDHIFCNGCLPSSESPGSYCPLCQAQYVAEDVRHLHFIDNMVTIYRGLGAAASTNLVQCSSSSADVCRFSKLVVADHEGGSSGEQSGVLLNADKIEDRPSNVEVGRSSVMKLEQAVQLSPGSPPSFGDVRGSEHETGGQGSAVEISESASLGKRSTLGMGGDESHGQTAFGTDSKKHKKLDCGPIGVCSNIGVFQALGTASQPSLLHRSRVTKSSTKEATCAFCQSGITEVTGPMMCYRDGKQVEGDNAMLPDVLHVHKTCIEWTPKIYFVGETVKNLKSELNRGSKIKCNKCRRKGAALGCYVKSCQKSYHVPCAMEIENCRWDEENYLLLCPDHSSVRFPNEESISKNHASKNCLVPSTIGPQQPKFWESSSSGVKEWTLCGSALSPEEKGLLAEFGGIIGVPVAKFWKSNVTHVIASVDSNGACTRTLKVLLAILNGRWVLTVDWVKACMQSMRPLSEEQYEINKDNYGCLGGPRTGRLSVLNDAPKLFNGLSFYFVGEFVPGYKKDLLNLVRSAGGFILESKGKLSEQTHDQGTKKTLIVYNLDPPEGCKLGEEVSTIWQRLSDAEDLAAEFGAQVIGHTWVLESIAAYKMQPFIIGTAHRDQLRVASQQVSWMAPPRSILKLNCDASWIEASSSPGIAAIVRDHHGRAYAGQHSITKARSPLEAELLRYCFGGIHCPTELPWFRLMY